MCWCGLQTKLESIDRKSWLSAAKSQWAWNRFQMRKLVKENAKKQEKNEKNVNDGKTAENISASLMALKSEWKKNK